MKVFLWEEKNVQGRSVHSKDGRSYNTGGRKKVHRPINIWTYFTTSLIQIYRNPLSWYPLENPTSEDILRFLFYFLILCLFYFWYMYLNKTFSVLCISRMPLYPLVLLLYYSLLRLFRPVPMVLYECRRIIIYCFLFIPSSLCHVYLLLLLFCSELVVSLFYPFHLLHSPGHLNVSYYSMVVNGSLLIHLDVLNCRL